ncbi:SMI1/KNR4 family protein [Nocardia sp. NPDC046763]|uniref:SMI1/KNR4 family protein n=1 Tax=Nocardia sp. NPDC046763 TaxID=3155256 RepID=UPI0033DB8550
MNPRLALLKSLMPPPPLPPVVAPPWTAIEQSMNLRLPADYRDFIDLYGDGQINHLLSVFFPARQHGPRPTLSVLSDNTQSLRDSGFFDDPAADGSNSVAGQQMSNDMLLWGQTFNGDLLFWSTEREDPDNWTVRVHFRHLDPGDSWGEFDGSMVDFLLALAIAAFPHTNWLIDASTGTMRWSRLRDWKHDYGRPPTAVFDDYVYLNGRWPIDGRRTADGALVPLREYGKSGGDQAHLWRTGEQRSLIELDDVGTAIRLSGGSQAPGIAYSVSGEADLMIENSMETVGVQLLCDGYAIATVLVEPNGRSRAEIEAEVRVPAGQPDSSIQLRVVARGPDNAVLVNRVHLQAKGTLGH